MNEANEYIVHSERNYEGHQPGTLDHIRGPEFVRDGDPEWYGAVRTDFYYMEDIAEELNRLRNLIDAAISECEFDKLPRESFRQAMIDLYCEIRPQDAKALRAEYPPHEKRQ